MSIRIGEKSCGPDGRFHQAREEFIYDALTGAERELPFSVYRTLPVDVDGDGLHELVRGVPGGDGEVLRPCGTSLGCVGGTVAAASKLLDLPGEQLLVYYADGRVRIYAHAGAMDSETAFERYGNPIYAANQRLTAVGYNLDNLGGL
jgi:hypothetical protein